MFADVDPLENRDSVLFFSSSYRLVWEKAEIKTHWVHCCLSFKTMCWAHVGRRAKSSQARVLTTALALLLPASWQHTGLLQKLATVDAKRQGIDWNTGDLIRLIYTPRPATAPDFNRLPWPEQKFNRFSVSPITTLWVMLFFAKKETQEIYCQIVPNKMKIMTILFFTVTKFIAPYWII